MKKIGLTGGIGSGKSTAAKVFEFLQVPVYYADEAAKELMNTDSNLKEQVMAYFGPETYLDGSLQRKVLANKVFGKESEIQKLNAIVHPIVFADFDKWCSERKHLPYIVKEAALIFETILHQKLDKVIHVSAPEELRIARVMLRDACSKEEVLNRIARQMNEEEKLQRADFVLYNDEIHPLLPQVVSLHQQIMQLV